jgi:hypothetical protein
MGGLAKPVVTLLMLLLVLGTFAAAADAWAAEKPTTPPTVKLVGPSPLTEHLKLAHGAFIATFNLSIENDGPLIRACDVSGCTRYKFDVLTDRIYSKASDVATITPNQARPLKHGFTKVPVTLVVHDSDTTSLTATLTLRSPPGVVPSTEIITLTRSPKSLNFAAIFIASLALGVSVLYVAWFFREKPDMKADSEVIYTDATFSFSQSWATGIAGLLTIVATVFSTTGVLTVLVPGIDTGFFLAVAIVYGVVLTLAPLVYSTLEKAKDGHMYGSHHGFVIAAAITAVAVGGQFSTVGAVIWLSDLNLFLRVAFLVLLGGVAAVVIAYTEATRRQLWLLPKPPTDPTTKAPLPATTMAALP